MARDYKHRASRKGKKKGVSPLFGVFAGLAIGLFVAFLVFLQMQKGSALPQAFSPAPEPLEQDVRDVRKDDTGAIPPPPKPRFTFYTTLPEMEVVVPDEEVEARVQASQQARTPGQPAAVPEPVKTGETWYLQVISLRDRQKAETLKAELALLGLETSIQTVTINGSDTYHRVRVGPFTSIEALDDARRTLGKQGFDSKAIRVKG